MAITSENLLVDRHIRGILQSKSTGEVLCMVDQIESPSFECSGEQVSPVDSLGVKVATFNRSKGVKFSAENSRINTSLLSAQFGSTKETASESAPIISPWTEVITVGFSTGTTANTTVTLEHTAVGTAGAEIGFIYKLNSDGSFSGTKYAQAAAASATEFAYAADTITLPTTTGALAGTDRFLVKYNYSAESGVRIANNASEFALGGLWDEEVLFADICDPTTKYHGHLVFGNVMLDPNVSINLGVEGKHPFGFESSADYCTAERNLCYWYITD